MVIMVCDHMVIDETEHRIFQETHSVMSGCSVCVHVWDQELPWTDKMPVPVAQAPKDELLIFPNMFKGLQGVV